MPELKVVVKQEMHRDKNQIPVSAMYTAATWEWANLPYSDLALPENAKKVFKVVNWYMKLYRWINPKMDQLQHMLLRRHFAINHLLRNSVYKQVVEIAAGFSPRGSWFSENPEVNYVEVDLPPVIAKKRELLARSSLGSLVLKRKNFSLKVGDIAKLDKNIFMNSCAVVVAEGIMMYFDRDQQLKIFKNIADHLRITGGELLFDYLPPMLNRPRSRLGNFFHFVKIKIFGDKSPYRYDDRTVSDLIEDLKFAGFDKVCVYDGDIVGKMWELPFSEYPAKVLIFQSVITV